MNDGMFIVGVGVIVILMAIGGYLCEKGEEDEH